MFDRDLSESIEQSEFFQVNRVLGLSLRLDYKTLQHKISKRLQRRRGMTEIRIDRSIFNIA